MGPNSGLGGLGYSSERLWTSLSPKLVQELEGDSGKTGRGRAGVQPRFSRTER
jgi:hypothetical protein